MFWVDIYLKAENANIVGDIRASNIATPLSQIYCTNLRKTQSCTFLTKLTSGTLVASKPSFIFNGENMTITSHLLKRIW